MLGFYVPLKAIIYKKEKRGTACYSPFLKALRKPNVHMNRQQTHAGNQRRNRPCHSCTFLNKFLRLFRNKNKAQRFLQYFYLTKNASLAILRLQI